eukprot:2320868-Prymnesium_polylepis.1
MPRAPGFGQHSRHISIHRVADKALEASRAEMSAKIDALELAAQDATSPAPRDAARADRLPPSCGRCVRLALSARRPPLSPHRARRQDPPRGAAAARRAAQRRDQGGREPRAARARVAGGDQHGAGGPHRGARGGRLVGRGARLARGGLRRGLQDLAGLISLAARGPQIDARSSAPHGELRRRWRPGGGGGGLAGSAGERRAPGRSAGKRLQLGELGGSHARGRTDERSEQKHVGASGLASASHAASASGVSLACLVAVLRPCLLLVSCLPTRVRA